MRITTSPHRYIPGNRVRPLFDASVTPDQHQDDIFHQVRLAIQNARQSIQLEMFGFGMMDIAEALVEAQQRGVEVQIVLDPPNKHNESRKSELVDYLQSEGVEVHFYPVARVGKYEQIQHAKILIVDGDAAIVGGMNWNPRSGLNRDANVLVEGPVVDRMEELFNNDFLISGGDPREVLPIRKTEPAGNSLVGLRATDEHDRGLEDALYRAVEVAERSILLEQFCLTHEGLRDGLIRAARRGVEVRVLMDPFEFRKTKWNEKAVKLLREHGVEVRWFVPDPELKNQMHAKLAIFDGRQVILGSANWSDSGMTRNREVNLDILEEEAAAGYTRVFQDDWKLGKPHPTYRYPD